MTRPDERQRAGSLDDEVGEKTRGLGAGGPSHRGAVLAREFTQQGRLPHRDRAGSVGRTVLGDLAAGCSDEPGRRCPRFRGRRGGEDEDGIGAVPAGHAPEPTQDQCDVRAEHTPVGVAFVDDDVPQAPPQPDPSRVGGQQRQVQHVGIGEDPARVPARPLPDLGGGVSVVGARAHARQCVDVRGQFGDRAQLVGTEGLRGRQVQGGGLRVVGQRAQDGQLVGDRLARRGAGGHHHVFPAGRDVGGSRLVVPGTLDTLFAEGPDDVLVCPLRPVAVVGGPGRDLRDVGQR